MIPSYRKIPNLNILPEGYRRPALSLLQAGLILIVIVALFLSYTAYQERSDNLDASADLKKELSRWTITEEMSQKLNEADLLRSEISSLQQELLKHEEASQQVKDNQIDWPGLLSGLLSPSGPTLENIAQNGLVISVTGTAHGIQELQQYRNNLLNLSTVSSIDIPILNQTDDGLAFKMVISVKGE